MIRLQVDFNSLDDEGRVLALKRLAPRPPKVGMRAYLLDDEGNRCWGTIAAVQGGLIHVDADWRTWTTSRQRHIEPQGWVQSSAIGSSSIGSVATTVTAATRAPKNDGDVPVRQLGWPLIPANG
jgi:hypothetical protein